MPSCDAQLPDKDMGFDAWIVQKLRMDWSSHDFGGLLTPSKLAEARAIFSHLETPVKIRLLLSLLSLRHDEANGASGKTEVEALLELTDKDADEWVQVSSGMVKQFCVLHTNGQPSDSYLHAQLEGTASKVVQAVAQPLSTRHNHSSTTAQSDVFSLENGLVNAAVRPPSVPMVTMHFTVSGEDEDSKGKDDDASVSPAPKPLRRPPIPRPVGLSTASLSSTLAATRLPQASKRACSSTKQHVTDLSSAIRRKADAGRFKRHRSRISMIDINEVKQIESDKAQKQEEWKRQKVAAKEREKEKLAKEKEKSTSASEKPSGGHGSSVASTVHDEHAAIAADIFAMHHQLGSDESIPPYSQPQVQTEAISSMVDGTPQGGGDDYVPDGTQALLNAAFHSTQDIMKEVVSQQNQQLADHPHLQPQPTYQDLYRPQPPLPMHHLVPSQQHYHQGFEPDEASLNTNNGLPMAFGGYNYTTTAGYYGDQFGNYGNAFSSTGFATPAMGPQDTSMGLPPLGGRPMGYDPTPPPNQPQNNGGYMGGAGEYWR